MINLIKKYIFYINYETCFFYIKKKYLYNSSKNIFLKIILIFFFFLIAINIFSFNNNYFIKFKYFIEHCNKFKKYNKTNFIKKKKPYLSICIPVYNMEKYIEKALLSIINQSFQEFEIILVNDNSNDNSIKIIEKLQSENKSIRIINHYKNLGVYSSRINAAFNAIGEYILFIDPDDILLNPYLFKELYNYNLKYNLDMIEFSVYHKEEKKKIYLPIYHEFNHYHNFKKKIIFQPDLSDIIFYIPNTNNYTPIFCRIIWNKIIRKSILINSILYIENLFHNIYLITADDTPINILCFSYANNYSNINIPGYLYVIRKNSMSRIDNENSHDLIVSHNYLLYYKLFYKYIKDFQKDLNFLFYDLKLNYFYILKFKDLNATEYIINAIKFFNEIIKNEISINFKNFIKNILLKLIN